MVRKIVIINEDLCNGCGLCTTSCHEGAISIVHGKAKLIRNRYCDGLGNCLPACPQNALSIEERDTEAFDEMAGRLNQWPVQLKLVAAGAPFLKDADLLISADCAAYSYGNFHNDFMKGKITLIGCPKLDAVDYSEKLAAILKDNAAKSVHVVRMEVPCCKGLAFMVENALNQCENPLPHHETVLSVEGTVL